MSNITHEVRNHGTSHSTVRTDRRRMGAAAALFSRTTDGREGTTKAGAEGDTERDLLDRPKRGSVAGSAGAVRAMADGVQAVQGVVGERPDRKNLP